MKADESIASADWSSLITRVFHDLARIVQTEIRLFQAGMEPILSNTVDRCLSGLVALMAFAAGGLCLLAAIVLYLSRWLGWPGSFAAAAAFSFVAGIVSMLRAKGRIKRTTSRVESSFDNALASAHSSE